MKTNWENEFSIGKNGILNQLLCYFPRQKLKIQGN